LTLNIGLDCFTGRPRQTDFPAFFFVIGERFCLFAFFDEGAANVFTSAVAFLLPKRMIGIGIGSSYIEEKRKGMISFR